MPDHYADHNAYATKPPSAPTNATAALPALMVGAAKPVLDELAVAAGAPPPPPLLEGLFPPAVSRLVGVPVG